uniref:Reverse transcriptase domain-containing protein n=1 Tax=Tanacetum cinerariifolium TaxID=118510 RepID=A0A699GH40_TANCI|nr:reverse transcriptase domain-containing protein [Tanacetum cinerariifolium]
MVEGRIDGLLWLAVGVDVECRIDEFVLADGVDVVVLTESFFFVVTFDRKLNDSDELTRSTCPMDDEPMWAADRVVAPTLGSAITISVTANEFTIKGNHLTLVKGNQFDGRIKTDPHKHTYKFLGEAKTWLDELNEGTIET